MIYDFIYQAKYNGQGDLGMANLSQIKREKMLAFLEALKEQHDDDESLMAINQIEKELTAKKYGLVWEEHEEEVDIKMQTHIPVFTEVKEKEIVGDSDSDVCNFLLEGDNLHSLKLLEKTHKGKIDVIYIDPPYNTGNKDFIYDDKCIGNDDCFKHSKWLSFMHRRLRYAHRLLNDKGVIFISIDDNEEAQLKLLCDEIFGSENSLGVIIQNKLNAKNDTVDIQKNHEYILAYRKKTNYISGTKVMPSLIKKEKKLRPAFVEDDRYYYISDAITTRGEGGTLNARPNLGYTVYYNLVTLEKVAVVDYDVELARTSNDANVIYSHREDMLNDGFVAIIPPKVRGKLGCWTWSAEKFNEQKDCIVITGKAPNYSVKKRVFVDKMNIEEHNGKLFYSSIEEKNSKSIVDFSTNEGTNTLTDVMGKSAVFNNPKNITMIKYFISMINRDDILVLDFFAGSGTTGQAVLELNQEDGGNRRFILCTNNENNICEQVTYQRLKTVITGKREDGSTYSDGLPANLKYYKTDFVAKDSEEIYDDLLEHIVEMIQLQYGIKIDKQKYVIIMDDDEMDEFERNFEQYDKLQALFINQDVFLSSSQEKLLDNVNTYMIPDCYFDFELREAGELW